MEIESCKIIDLFYCIWFENGLFQVEDVDANKILPLSNFELSWLQEVFSELSQKPENQFFLKLRSTDTSVWIACLCPTRVGHLNTLKLGGYLLVQQMY